MKTENKSLTIPSNMIKPHGECKEEYLGCKIRWVFARAALAGGFLAAEAQLLNGETLSFIPDEDYEVDCFSIFKVSVRRELAKRLGVDYVETADTAEFIASWTHSLESARESGYHSQDEYITNMLSRLGRTSL